MGWRDDRRQIIRRPRGEIVHRSHHTSFHALVQCKGLVMILERDDSRATMVRIYWFGNRHVATSQILRGASLGAPLNQIKEARSLATQGSAPASRPGGALLIDYHGSQ